MLKRIRIRNYKSFDDVDVKLGSLNVLFGPNGSGKSNFLDALQLLSRLAVSSELNDAFRQPHRGTPLQSVRFGPEGIKGVREKDRVSFSFEIEVCLSAPVVDFVNAQLSYASGDRAPAENAAAVSAGAVSQAPSLKYDDEVRYLVEIEVIPGRGFARIYRECLWGLRRGRSKQLSPVYLEREGTKLLLVEEGRENPIRLTGNWDHAILASPPLNVLSHPHLYALRMELMGWLFFYFEPRQVMRLRSPVREVRFLGQQGDELGGFLNTLQDVDPQRFETLEKQLRLIVPSVTGIQVGVNDAGEVELKLLEHGAPVPAQLISDGTLRILGLLALGVHAFPPTLVGLEEPENGIHPRRIRLIAELLRNRALAGNTQMVVTTHSPILPNIIPVDSLLVCLRENGASRLRRLNDWSGGKRGRKVQTLLDQEEMSVAERILRGDFDAV